MEESSLVRLDLRAPLWYAEAPGLEPFAYTTEALCGEELFCFEIDPAQGRTIEPDRDRFLGALVFAGRDGGAETVRLPAGLYLFTQQRTALGREECTDLAIEQQKDGLWERLRPENRLYVRYLFEDGRAVTQLFRPYSEAAL